jgi:hypothetical protein
VINSYLNRLYTLRRVYDTIVVNAAIPRIDAAIIAIGVKLARY